MIVREKNRLYYVKVVLFAIVVFSTSLAWAEFRIPDLPRVNNIPDLLNRSGEHNKGSISFTKEQLHNSKIKNYVNSIVDAVSPSDAKERYYIEIYKTARVQGISYSSGWMAITRGMLNMMVNEAELACFIGHEIGHQQLDHLSRRVEGKSQSQEMRRLLSQVLNELPNSGPLAEVFDDIAENGWSRVHEQEADEYGAMLCAKAGYDPYALVDLFERLAVRVKSDPLRSASGYKRTHKALGQRAKELRELLITKGFKKGYGKRNYRSYVRSLDPLTKIRTEKLGSASIDSVKFMQEHINQDEPIWDEEALDQLYNEGQQATYDFLEKECNREGDERQIPSRDADAFGHCWYACEATKRYGWEEAYTIGTGHEVWREIQDKLGIKNHDSFDQDINNQESGRSLGLHREFETCAQACDRIYRFEGLDLSAPRTQCYSCSLGVPYNRDAWTSCPSNLRY